MAADSVWEQIKTEFITEGTKPRELAKKYRVSKNTVYQRAKEEDWEGQRVRFWDEAGTKTRDELQNQIVDEAVRLVSAADALLEKVIEIIDNDNPKHMTPAGVRHISETLLNLKSIKNIRSEEDIAEQRARIAKLQRDARAEENGKEPIRIIIDDGLSEYSN